MRRCLLLPIQDSGKQRLGFKVFEEVESYLKSSDWCYYRSNSPVLDVLSGYKRNLNKHLDNTAVLKTIAEKTKSGTLIRVKIDNELSGVMVSMKLISGNGQDIYLQEKTRVDSDDSLKIAQTVKNWLENYRNSIPYDGLVVGVLGDQFTVDMGQQLGLYDGSQVVVRRVVRKKKHPLLKEIVDWETHEVGRGEIFHTTEWKGRGKIKSYQGKRRLKIGDWVSVKRPNRAMPVEQIKYESANAYRFGKLGFLSFSLSLGRGSSAIQGSSTDEAGGMVVGVDLETELWITRRFWTALEFGRKHGRFKKEKGLTPLSSNSTDISKFRFTLGARYLPMGFFYGPRADAYIGYGNYTHAHETEVSYGLTEFSLKGILFGVKGSIPIQKMVSANMDIGFLLNPSYSEDTRIYGGANSTSNYHFDIGLSYAYSPRMRATGSYEFIYSKAKFDRLEKGIKLRSSSFRMGLALTF